MTASVTFRLSKILILFAALCASAAGASAPEAQLSTPKTVDGGLVIVSLRLSEADGARLKEADLSAHFEDHDFPFFPGDEPGLFMAMVAVPHSLKAGDFEVTVTGATSAPLRLPLKIEDGNYKSEKVNKVPKKTVKPPKSEQKRIRAEQAETGAIYQQIRREKLWKGPFIKPVDSPFTSPYGTKRVFNGSLQGFHQGLDLKAAIGTPIQAPAGGVVTLAKDLFFSGGTVILDHGYGLFTVYAHLSKIGVHVGDRVKSGQQLGLAGMTGRANGPHLHWSAVVRKVKVDPMYLLKVLK